MTFDNSKTIISLRIKLFAATVVVLAWLAMAYVGKIIKFPFLGMSDIFWTLILIVIWLAVAFLPMYLNYQYISYSDEGEKIIFRYFSAGMIGGKKNSVEITKHSFSGYEVETKFFGLIRSIILYQKFREGVAKYPPVYISALKSVERDKIFRSLNLLSRKS
jgi:hypothetical protein